MYAYDVLVPTPMTPTAKEGERGSAGEAPHWSEHEEELCEVFRLLADRGRMRIVLHLRASGELPVAELAVGHRVQQDRLLPAAAPAARMPGWLHRRREGRNAFYSLFDEHVAELVDLVRRHLEEERG